MVRWLRASGLAVRYVRNITDVDDKIMERARSRDEPIEALTERTVAAFAEDCARLNLLVPDSEPRATRYIGPMVEFIEVLEKKGLAYRGANGDVYYSVRDFPGYGKLSRRNLDELRAGERVAVEAAKRDPLDFVLWKAAKPGEPSWPSVFGAGRPGWHIECSAMSCRELGETFDIHGGGWDLQFPHHENEIAQSEGANAKPFVNYWMHSAFLNMGDEKMSKSLGNVFTAREVLARLDPVQGGEQLRFFLLRGHYRSELSYTWDLLEDAGNTLRGFYTTLRETAPEAVAVDWSQPLAAALPRRDGRRLRHAHRLRRPARAARGGEPHALPGARGPPQGPGRHDRFPAGRPGGVPEGGRGGRHRRRTRWSPSARRRRRRATSRARTRSARSSTRRASSSRTSPGASRSGARNEKGPRAAGLFLSGMRGTQRTNFWSFEMIVRSTNFDPLWLSGE